MTAAALRALAVVRHLAVAAVLCVLSLGAWADFDATDPTDLLALQQEVTIDPAGQGYAEAAGTADLLDRLNNPARNAAPQNVQQPVEVLTVPAVAGVINAGEYDALGAYNRAWVQMLITRPATEPLAPYSAKFLAVFPAGSATRTAVINLLARPASRAEVLFGIDTVISRDDWFAARDHQP